MSATGDDDHKCDGNRAQMQRQAQSAAEHKDEGHASGSDPSATSTRARTIMVQSETTDTKASAVQPAAAIHTEQSSSTSDSDVYAQSQPQSQLSPQADSFTPLAGPILAQGELMATRDDIGRLADVELQLVLQFLNTSNKLKAARWSRRLLQVARQPFAWKDVDPLVISIRRLSSVPSTSHLLRLIPLSLQLERGDHFNIQGSLVAQFPSAALVRELHVVEPAWAFWDRLLVSPAILQSLQRLSVPDCYDAPDRVLPLLAQLPHLRSLSCRLGMKSDISPLASAPELAHLSLRISFDDLRTTHPIGQCLQLRSLRLAAVENHAVGFGDWFALRPAPEQRLERLELEGFLAQPNVHMPWTAIPTAAEMCGGLAAMRHLTELRLARIHPVDALLACLHAAPALRLLQLDLQPQRPDKAGSVGSIQPSADVFRTLLDRTPQLHVRLRLPSLDDWLAEAYGLSSHACPSQDEAAEQWHGLRRDLSGIARVVFM